MKKIKALTRLLESGLVAIVRAETGAEAVKIAEACRKGGVSVIEVTFTVPDAADVIRELSARFGAEDVVIGAGSVLDSETARMAILAGAQFVVSPALSLEIARLANRYGVPYMPGATSVREIVEAMECGSDIVKVFPGESLGPEFIRAVLGPLPQASLMPTSGVGLDNVEAWIRAGAVAVGVGGHLTSGAKTGDFQSITDLSTQFLDAIRRARS